MCLLSPGAALYSTLLCFVSKRLWWRADGQNGPGALVACAARRWLARYAAGVKSLSTWKRAPASACVSLVSCLPALEDVDLSDTEPATADDSGSLLEALAWCPRLRALKLCIRLDHGEDGVPRRFPVAPALAKLRGLTRLTLSMADLDTPSLDSVARALASLPGLAELTLTRWGCESDASCDNVVPAALGQLKGLRALAFDRLHRCALQAGCLDLPNLQSLVFRGCSYRDAAVLPCITALCSLTGIEFLGGQGPGFFDPQLIQLPRLQHIGYNADEAWLGGPHVGLPPRLPADLGSLRSSLQHLDFSGQGLAQFPLAVTQLVALECLNAEHNEFAEVPAAISALSRLTELTLGRIECGYDPLQGYKTSPLDARLLGDLSAFPALCELTFRNCEVLVCNTVPGAARHPCLVDLTFWYAHPAPRCAPALLRLAQEAKKLGRGSFGRMVHLIHFTDSDIDHMFEPHPQGMQVLWPWQDFEVALYGL